MVHPGITVYPNPVTSQLIIHGLNSVATNLLTFTNAAGQAVQRANATGETYQWNLQNLPPGIYHVTIISAKQAYVSFIMKG